MCRLAAYSGQQITLSKFLIEPEHSLYRQSWAPAEMDEAVLNADGFGFGWYHDTGVPHTYTSTLPVWSDHNLIGLGAGLSSRIWLANVRSATPGQSLSHDNTQPFNDGRYLFMHNGFIDGFNAGVRRSFHDFLPPQIQADIRGNTDSEYLFAIFRNAAEACNHTEVGAILEKMLRDLDTVLGSTKALLNMVVCDGRSLAGIRHARNGGKCPTLYWSDNQPDFPGSMIISSERLTSVGKWHRLDEHSLVQAVPGKPAICSGL